MLASTAPLIYTLAAVLIAVALGLFWYGLRLVKLTRHDHRSLAPLEVMAGRRWRGTDDTETRQSALDQARPEGAEPLPASAVDTVAAEESAGTADLDDVEIAAAEAVEGAEVPEVDPATAAVDVDVTEVVDEVEALDGHGEGADAVDAADVAVDSAAVDAVDVADDAVADVVDVDVTDVDVTEVVDDVEANSDAHQPARD